MHVRGPWGGRLALAAACLFLLQVIFGAWTIGAAEASPRLDIFGNPLCVSSDTPDAGHSIPGHAALCSAACVLGVHAADAPPRQFSLLHQEPAEFIWETRTLADRSVRLADYDPQNPRAPPLTA